MLKCGNWERGDIEGVRQKINEFGAQQVVTAQLEGWTCLHMAAHWGYPNIIDLLIENGADLDPENGPGVTPLREAIKWREYSCITTLIKLGADLEMAKVANHGRRRFDSSMRDEKTKAAIAEGQRLAGEKQKKQKVCNGDDCQTFA